MAKRVAWYDEPFRRKNVILKQVAGKEILGYHDGNCWRSIDGTKLQGEFVWSDIPDFMKGREDEQFEDD